MVRERGAEDDGCERGTLMGYMAQGKSDTLFRAFMD